MKVYIKKEKNEYFIWGEKLRNQYSNRTVKMQSEEDKEANKIDSFMAFLWMRMHPEKPFQK